MRTWQEQEPDLRLRKDDIVRVIDDNGRSYEWKVTEITFTLTPQNPIRTAMTMCWDDMQSMLRRCKLVWTARAPGYKVWRNRWDRKRHAA